MVPVLKNCDDLSFADIGLMEGYLGNVISHHKKELEKNLFILSTTFALSPFLGLLGTMWGILLTFSELQHSMGSTNEAVLAGLSLALTTTVLGLIGAIPALIAYNYLKSRIGDFEIEMEGFSHEILSAVELNYRQVSMA